MQPALVDLEATLAADTDGAVRQAMAAELREARDSLRLKLARGGPPEQYTRWSASERALTAALSVIETVRIEAHTPPPDGPAVTLKGA